MFLMLGDDPLNPFEGIFFRPCSNRQPKKSEIMQFPASRILVFWCTSLLEHITTEISLLVKVRY